MKRVLILYHSGAGSTKTIAEIYREKLKDLSPDLMPLTLPFPYEILGYYDLIILGFPTYHGEAPHSMVQFVEKMPSSEPQKAAFLFTTYGLYPANSLYHLGKKLKEKNYALSFTAGYRAPATDAALLLPPMKPLFRYGKKTSKKLKTHLNHIRKCIVSSQVVEVNPRFRLHALLNYPNQYFGKRVTHQLMVNDTLCVQCNRCVHQCILKCWHRGSSSLVPVYDNTHCEYCFKCVHHCPSNAIMLSSKTKERPKLNQAFYQKRKEALLSCLNHEECLVNKPQGRNQK